MLLDITYIEREIAVTDGLAFILLINVKLCGLTIL